MNTTSALIKWLGARAHAHHQKSVSFRIGFTFVAWLKGMFITVLFTPEG